MDAPLATNADNPNSAAQKVFAGGMNGIEAVESGLARPGNYAP
jgi:hypothetical protein